MRIMA